jgi:tripartite-type tricarboxylate transporter receptor subunit TctC
MRKINCLVILFLSAAGCFTASAQTYPSKPVRIIVPFVPGGTVDLVARALATQLTEQSGQAFVVENRAGASGVIGSDLVAKSSPDGYTLLVQSPTLVASPLMLKKVPYDVFKDFTPVTLLGSVPMIMVTSGKNPSNTISDFLKYAQDPSRKASFGTSAVGSPMHLAMESIKFNSKLDVPVVAYRGTAAALNDLLGGQIDAIIDALPSTAQHIASGKLKALAVTTKKRLPAYPQIPTLAESGFPEFEMVSWYGLWAPANLPTTISKQLAEMSSKAMKSKSVRDLLVKQGFVPELIPGDQFAGFMTRELAQYSRIVLISNIQID